MGFPIEYSISVWFRMLYCIEDRIVWAEPNTTEDRTRIQC